MPRLRNTKTDAVLSCSEEVAARLGSEWEPADEAKKAPAKKAASSKSDN